MSDSDEDAGIKVSFPDNTKGSTPTNKGCFNLLRNGKQNTPVLIYTSCTSVPFKNPHDLAKKINPKLHDYFTSLPNGKWTTGWIMMDLSSSIIL